MKLANQVNIGRELRGEYPIGTWHDMKAHLNQKYRCTHGITELKKR